MLPCDTGKDVLRTSSKKKDNPDLGLMECWRKRLGIKAGEEISSDTLVDDMLKMPKGGHDFKQLFVLYALGTFLAPTCHNHVDLKLIKAVENVEDIINQDWCLYVVEKLNEVVDKWKEKRTKNVGGCMMLLQILYFHRLIWRDNKNTLITIPLVKHWTYEKIKVRVEDERAGALKNNNEYGRGGWDKKTYPISRNLPKVIYRLPTEGDDPRHDDRIKRTTTFELPSDLLSDEEIASKYNDPRLVSWMMTKRDLELVSRLHENRTKEVEKQANVTPIDEEQVREEMEGEFTQALKDPNFLAQFLDMGKRIDEIAEMKLVEAPSFDLGIDSIGINDSIGTNDTNCPGPSQKKSVHCPKRPRDSNKSKSVYVRRCTRLATKNGAEGAVVEDDCVKDK
ncbi:uncharacterized protein LOC141630741 [Silene latifolia]|uniref:uncharacterized protein LOC141630741 n=1 Tax=Silene latifolia TaxID=37657 RepID=UPI003D76FB42